MSNDTEIPRRDPEFLRGWEAALQAVHDWHLARSKQSLTLARRSRFPKALERDAELHEQSAGLVKSLDPDDV